MGTLQQVQEKGLTEKLEATIAGYVVSGSDSAEPVNKLRSAIDEHGFKSPIVMKMIGALQKTNVLTPGLYKDLVQMHNQLDVGDAATDAAGANASTEGFSFTEKQEQKIRERLEKEKDRLLKRLVDKESKIRERFAARAEKRATRLGIRVDDSKEVIVQKEIINNCREQVRALRVQIAEARAKMRELKPKRERVKKEKPEAAPEVAPA